MHGVSRAATGWIGPRRALRLREPAVGYLFVAPALVLLLAVLVYPALTTLRLSVTLPAGQLGMQHYGQLLSDPLFWQVVRQTAAFVVASVSAHLLLGLGAALAVAGTVPARGLFRVVALLPWVVPDVVAGIVWKWILNPLYGVLNDLLMAGRLVDQPVEWLTHPSLAPLSLILANVWRGFPFVMVILLAGLQSIPQDLYEAASLDGAGSWARFRFVTLPGLRKVLVVALALDTIWEVRRFGLVQAMTGGGPGTLTEVLSTQVFKQYFQFYRFEYASAMAVAMTVLLLAVSLPYVRMIMQEE